MIRKILEQLLFVGFVLAATVGLMEIGSRFLFPEWAPVSSDRSFWTYDPVLGWSGLPHSQGRFEYIDFSTSVSINSAGLRDSEYPIQRVPGKRRMLLLADSFGWGFGVEQNEIWAERIEANNQGWEIINASVSGYGTDQEFLYYQERGRLYEPDVVLLLFWGWNDFQNSSGPVQYWHNKPFFELSGDGLELKGVPVPPASWTQKAANYISGNTYFLRTLSSWIREGLSTSGAAASRPKNEDAELESGEVRSEEPIPAGELTDDEERVVRLILELNQAVRDDGARLIVIYTRGRSQIFSEPRLVEAGLALFSLENVFRETKKKVFFEHDGHWTAEGHRIVAEAAQAHLVKIGLFGSQGSKIEP